MASNEEHQNLTSPKPITTPTTSSLITHISFSYDPSDDDEEEGEDLRNVDKDDFQYVPVSSQSKLVQFQFLTFARQQQLDIDNEDNEKQDHSDDDEEEDEDKLVGQNMEEDEEKADDEEEEEQEVS